MIRLFMQILGLLMLKVNSNNVNFIFCTKFIVCMRVDFCVGLFLKFFFLWYIYPLQYNILFKLLWNLSHYFWFYCIYIYAGLSSYIIGNKRFSILLLVLLCFISGLDGYIDRNIDGYAKLTPRENGYLLLFFFFNII